MTRAALYLRISQDSTGEMLGVTRQREDCLELIETLGWTLVDTFTDNDRSAYKVRPEYQRMLAEVDAGQIDAIVAWHPDRLYRVVKDLGELVDVAKRNNTQIATVKAGTVDLTTPTGRLVAGLLAQVATYEGEAKSDRWRRSWRQGREAGRRVNTGSRMYGYTREGEIVDDEADIARQMATKILEGQAILGVARWLDEQGAVATRGQAWTPQSIKRYLTNPRIAGWSTLNGEIVAEGDWEPILDRETWEAVRALLTARTREHKPRVALLLGLLHCGSCGHRMITSGQAGKRTYRCPNRPGMNGCGRVSGNAEPIEDIVESYARERLRDDRVRQRIAELRAEPTEAQSEVASLELRITELEQQLDEPGVPVATLLRAVERARERQAQLLSDLAARNITPLPVGDEWPDDLRRRRALIDLVVERVELHPATKAHASRLGFDVERVTIAGR